MEMWLGFQGDELLFCLLLYSDLCVQKGIDIFGVKWSQGNYEWTQLLPGLTRGGDCQSTRSRYSAVCMLYWSGCGCSRPEGPRGLRIIIIYIIPYMIMQNPNSSLSILAPTPQNKLLSVPLPLWAIFFLLLTTHILTHARILLPLLCPALVLNNNTHTHFRHQASLSMVMLFLHMYRGESVSVCHRDSSVVICLPHPSHRSRPVLPHLTTPV